MPKKFKFSTKFPYVKKGQTIIIPKGLISSSKTAIIEIPETLQNAPTVIVTPQETGAGSGCSMACSTLKESYIFPKAEDASASLDPSQFTRSAASGTSHYVTARSGSPTHLRSSSPGPSTPACPLTATVRGPISGPVVAAHPAHMHAVLGKTYPPTAGLHRPMMHEGGTSYGGMGYDYTPDYSGTFYRNLPSYIDNTSIVGPHFDSDLSNYEPEEYEDFGPVVCSTPIGYQQSANSFLNALDYSVPPTTTPIARGGVVEKNLRHLLDQIDEAETSQLQDDLKDVQQARRKLVFNASNVKH